MLPQWKDEMEARFGLTFQILDRNYIDQVRQQYGFAVNPWTTFPRFLVSHNLLIDEAYAGPFCAWLENFRAGTLLILDEAHHAAPSSGARYAIDSRITRAIRDIAPRFEHRLFLSATPHNGHSNSFSALLEILDSYRFTRGVPVLKGQLDQVMVRRLKEDIRRLEGGFPERIVAGGYRRAATRRTRTAPREAAERLRGCSKSPHRGRNQEKAGRGETAHIRTSATPPLIDRGLRKDSKGSSPHHGKTLGGGKLRREPSRDRSATHSRQL